MARTELESLRRMRDMPGALRRARGLKPVRRMNGTPVNGRGAIRERNEARILKAAEAVFAKKGFNGASTAEIARKAGVPKPNLHYYFRTKQVLYAGVLDNILEIWLDAMDEIRPGAEPADALGRYIARKLDSSRTLPEPSRLWAMELISGARHVEPFLKKRLRRLVQQKSAIIRGWAAAGQDRPGRARASAVHDLGDDPDLCRFRGANRRRARQEQARRGGVRRGVEDHGVAGAEGAWG